MKLHGLVMLLAWTAAATAAEPQTGAAKPPPRFAVKPLAQDYYPSASQALGEQGTVELRLCHDEFGYVTDIKLQQSSGFARLDQSALKMGSSYYFKPVVINGKGQPDCAVVPVKFSLTPPAGPPDRGEGGDIPRRQSSPPVRLVPLNANGVAWDGKTVPITIEVSKGIHVYSREPGPQEPKHERGSLHGNGDFVVATGQRFKVIKLLGEGTCRIEFAGQEYHLHSCPWMPGYADPRADIFTIVEVKSGE